MSDVYSLFEKEAADPQAFNKVREGDTKDLSSLIRRSIDLDKQIKDTEALLKDLQRRKDLLMRKIFLPSCRLWVLVYK